MISLIIGLGTDIVENSRIKSAISRERFLRKIYTDKEILCLSENTGDISKFHERFAANFCAKESVAKALGVGFRWFSPSDIEVLRDDFGKPFVALHGGAKSFALSISVSNIFLSLSHCALYSVASVVLEGGFDYANCNDTANARG